MAPADVESGRRVVRVRSVPGGVCDCEHTSARPRLCKVGEVQLVVPACARAGRSRWPDHILALRCKWPRGLAMPRRSWPHGATASGSSWRLSPEGPVIRSADRLRGGAGLPGQHTTGPSGAPDLARLPGPASGAWLSAWPARLRSATQPLRRPRQASDPQHDHHEHSPTSATGSR